MLVGWGSTVLQICSSHRNGFLRPFLSLAPTYKWFGITPVIPLPTFSFSCLFFRVKLDVIFYSILIARLVRGGWLVQNWRGLCVWRVAWCPAGGRLLKSSLRDQNWKQHCAISLLVTKTMGPSALWTSCWMMSNLGGPGAREHHVWESLRDQGLFLGKMFEIWLYIGPA